ncbi:NUDIX hydrolase [Limnobacter parvus]|uniref:NUDIX domain-containing protein n=1 Tax=Limnobacter parvus TaxID=2939690 RepID=A0ABT1XIK2_9BURK|nr:NUDIX domain-containing protein [Limnobacter parvus]MCR2747096.1 NUDIX domain-containing protein [Limnobacter parvus]
MISAHQDWLQNNVPAHFKPFIARWRDGQSAPSQRFCNWYLNDEHLGHLDRQHLHLLLPAFEAADLPLTQSLRGFDLFTDTNAQALSAAFASIANRLRALGLVPGWRDEEQLVLSPRGQILATAERALFKTLGLRSRAVHVHVENHLGHIWVGVRATSKHENPGMLDNLAAGGIASAETVESTLWRELDEEAGLNSDDFSWIKPLVPHELVLSRPLLYGGWHHETVILFHGQLKLGHRPCNRDGEVGAFQLMRPKACVEAVNAWQFTPDAALCCALALSATK